jgi:tetratricopeptide (TPR) repeat protein
MRDEIRRLRESVNDRVTRAEFIKMAERTSAEIGSIKRRLDDLEERVEKLEVENADLKKGTKNASDAKYFKERGDRLASGNKFRAIANYNIAVALDPNDAETYRKRSEVYAKMGAPDVVILDATEAIRLNPKDRRSFENRGEAYESKKEFDQAVADYAASARLRAAEVKGAPKTEWILYFMWGNDHLTQNKPYRAIAEYSEAIRVDATLFECYYGRGLAYHQLKEYDRAIADYTQAIRLDKKSMDRVNYYKARARAYYDKSGNKYDARGDGDRVRAMQVERGLPVDPER